MTEQSRNKQGQFAPKSDEIRRVRSVRVTDTTWEQLGAMAEERGITRADLLEEWVGSEKRLSEAIAVLEEALTLKANAGGAIKAKIREGLEKLTKPTKIKKL